MLQQFEASVRPALLPILFIALLARYRYFIEFSFLNNFLNDQETDHYLYDNDDVVMVSVEKQAVAIVVARISSCFGSYPQCLLASCLKR